MDTKEMTSKEMLNHLVEKHYEGACRPKKRGSLLFGPPPFARRSYSKRWIW